MNNILFINYFFNPIKGMGTVRNTKLAKYMALNNWNVYVITTLNNLLFPKEDILRKGSNKIKKIGSIPTFDYQTVKLIMTNIVKLFKSGQDFYSISFKKGQFLYYLFELFPLNFLIGEGGLLYIFLGIIRSLFLIRKYNIKYIYSSFSPFSDHFIAYILKLLKSDLIWVADFRDLSIERIEEFISCSKFTKKTNRQINKLLLSKANLLTTVSDGFKERLIKYNSNVQVIRNGFDEDDYAGNNSKGIDLFSFFYAGSIYPGKQDAGILFQSLNELMGSGKIAKNDVKLNYAGKHSHLYFKNINKNISDICIDLKFLRREKVIELDFQNYFLILLTWFNTKEKGIIPAKFYEYLVANRPIICIVNGDRDLELENIFNKIKCGIVIYNRLDERNKISKFILDHYKNFKKQKFSTHYNNNERDKFSFVSRARELSEVLLKIRKEKREGDD